MKPAVALLCLMFASAPATAEPLAYRIREVRFIGDSTLSSERLAKVFEDLKQRGRSTAHALCGCLLEARRIAESQGRLDFSADIGVAVADEGADITARVRMGSAHAVGRITFSGNHGVNDSTIRRTIAVRERDVFDVLKLRRGLGRLNETGLFEPITLADILVAKHADGVTADLTIPLRERGRRRWSLSGPVVPGFGSLRASISSRLPGWGRGIFDASTYYLSLQVMGFARPLLRLLPFASNARPQMFVALERPYLPGQGAVSGFVLSPWLSTRDMLAQYGSMHAARAIHAALSAELRDGMVVPVTTATGAHADILVCEPPKPRLAWLRRAGTYAIDLALAALLP
jgi:hypothetical protein